MRFLYSHYLFWIAVLPFVYFIWLFLQKKMEKDFDKFISIEMQSKLFQGKSLGRIRFKVFLLILSLAFFILALSRPQMGSKEESVVTEGIDVVFLLDVSNSMLTEDVVPSRIKKAKHIIKTFLEKMAQDRVGVVLYAGSAYPAIPLTIDYDYIKQTLEVLSENSIANQGTDLNKALMVSYDLIDRGGVNDPEVTQDGKGRAIIILSDGETHSKDKSEAIGILKKSGVTVYTIGIGTERGGPIPMRDTNGNMLGLKKDRSGSAVLSKLESKSLEELSNATGGLYFNASTDEAEVDNILRHASGLEHSEGEGRKIIVYEELFQYPLGMGLLLFFIFLYMSNVSKSVANLTLILIFLFAQTVSAQTTIPEYQQNKKGVDAYKAEDYPEAIRRFGEAQAENPDQSLHSLNLGDALYQSKSYEQSIKEFEKLSKIKDPILGAMGDYNQGRAWSELKDHEKAIQSYQSALDRLNTTPDASAEMIAKIKRALQESQQQKNNQKNQENENKDKKPDQNENKDQKENKDQEKEKDEPKQYKNPKPKFKPEKLKEEDAKRILKQLQEQEKKTQSRLMKQKIEKGKEEKQDQDW